MAELRGKFVKHLQDVHKDHQLENNDAVAKHQVGNARLVVSETAVDQQSNHILMRPH
jgi:hypothetical protein